MPSFSWTGYFREGQWRALRKFILEERQDSAKRVLAITSELKRIGSVRITYAKNADGTQTTETRTGFKVDEGSSLEKLLSAYVALGGNPYDISMFLTPENAIPVKDAEGLSPQPGGGVATSEGLSYTYTGGMTAADTNLNKYKPSRAGGARKLPEAQVGGLINRGRQWVHQEIQFKRNALEARIIKLCDLREQLLQELEDIAWAMFGENVESVLYSSDRYDDSQTVAGIVFTFDSIFRIPSEDGRVEVLTLPEGVVVSEATPGLPNNSKLAVFPNLITDDDGGSENNNAL